MPVHHLGEANSLWNCVKLVILRFPLRSSETATVDYWNLESQIMLYVLPPEQLVLTFTILAPTSSGFCFRTNALTFLKPTILKKLLVTGFDLPMSMSSKEKRRHYKVTNRRETMRIVANFIQFYDNKDRYGHSSQLYFDYKRIHFEESQIVVLIRYFQILNQASSTKYVSELF